MKRTMLILVLLGLVLALTSLHLVQQLRKEQAAVAALESQLAQLRSTPAHIPAPQTIIPVPHDVAVLEHESAGVVLPVAPPAPAMEDVQQDALDNPQLPGGSFRRSELLGDPEYRAALRQRNLLTLPRTMPGIREALGLSEDQAAQLFELLADQQVQSSAVPVSDMQSGQSREERQRLLRQQRQVLDEQAQVQIQQLLGDQGFQRWQDYRSTLGVRHQVEQMRTTLARRGVVMDEQLLPVLVGALADEQASWSAQQQAATRDTAGSLSEQRLQMRRSQQDRSLQTVLPYLTGEQRRVLQEEQQAGLVLLESQMNLMRLQREAGQRQGGGG